MINDKNPFDGLDENPSVGKNPFEGKDLSIDKNPTSKNPIKVEAMRSPLVILYGPRAVGKTMVLLRTVQYLKKMGYTVNLDEGFRSDKDYQRIATQFDDFLADPSIAARTNLDGSLLLNISFQGKFQFQMLEDAGEHFFDTNKSNGGAYPAHLVKLFKENKKKIFIFFFEKNLFGNAQKRVNYADKIKEILNKYVKGGRDNIIFLYNKIDKLDVFRDGVVQHSEVYEHFRHDEYNALFSATSARDKRFIPFSAGEFVQDEYLLSDDVYPQALAEVIQESIKEQSKEGLIFALVGALVAIIVILILLLQ